MISQAVFFHRLNQSVPSSVKELLWSEYKQQVTDIILNHLKRGERIGIIGAGLCDDFDLKQVVTYAGSVSLWDIDETSLESAIIREQISNENIHIQGYDFTCLSQHRFFEELDILIKEGSSVEVISQYITNVFDRLNPKIKDVAFEKMLYNKEELIVVLPIYSQLVLPPFQTIMNQVGIYEYSKNEIEAIYSVFLEKAVYAIHMLNAHIAYFLKNKSKVLLFTDILEYHEGNSIFNHLDKLSQKQLRDLEQSYVNQYGYGFGHYGLEHLKGYAKLKHKHFLVWPYTKERKMIVKCSLAQK